MVLLYKLNVRLLAVQFPGKKNKTADYISRIQNEKTEWRLSPITFQRICYCKLEFDPSTPCINCQLD